MGVPIAKMRAANSDRLSPAALAAASMRSSSSGLTTAVTVALTGFGDLGGGVRSSLIMGIVSSVRAVISRLAMSSYTSGVNEVGITSVPLSSPAGKKHVCIGYREFGI